MRYQEDTTIAEVIADVLRRRSAGEVLNDEEIIGSHPDLLPRLREELDSLSRIRQAYLASRRAGIADAPIEPMQIDELESPIELDSADSVIALALPTIEGYVLLDELGCGGQATVFRAKQESTGQGVAIKVLLGGAAAGSRNRARFEREAAILAHVNHPHIVRIVDRGRTRDGAFFLAMEYIDGLPLDRFVAGPEPINRVSLVDLWLRIVQAVAEAHRHGVVHRDIKPSNILVDFLGEPHVLDFGLASAKSEIWLSDRPALFTVTGQVLGSLPWASPEQVAGSHHDVEYSSDVYSLGVVFYQTLAGSFPYPVTGPISQVMEHIASTQPMPPSRLADRQRSPLLKHYFQQPKGKIAKLDAILLKALAKRPEKRYPSAAELAEDLQNVVADKPISASPKRRQRHFAVCVSLLSVLLVAMAVQRKWFNSASTRTQSTYRPSLVNDFGMTFVRILPQTYSMGSPPDEPKRRYDELLHYVAITKTIYMQTTDVTQGEYAAVMGSIQSGKLAPSEQFLPVVNVSWDDANAFCRELEKKDRGRYYRLPTEAEWELACRAGGVGECADGKPLQEIGWFRGNSGGRLHPVAGKQPNSWGLFDMEGNAAEWCADYYHSTYRFEPGQATTDPTGPTSGEARVIRGGSFAQPEEMCRCAARGGILPTDRRPDVGFRVVMQPR